MKTGMSFRTKLALVVVPPLLVILILATAVVVPQLSQASGTRDDQERVQIALVAMQLLDELEIEQGLSARRVVNGTPDLIAELQAQRSNTDAARAAFVEAIDSVGSLADGPDGESLLEPVPLRAIDSVRVLIDRGDATVGTVIDNAVNQLDALTTVITTLVSQTEDSELLRRATAIGDQVLAKSFLATAVNRMAGRLEAQDLVTADYLRFQNSYQQADTFYDRFDATADAVGAAKLAEVQAVPEVATLAKEAERIIEAAQGEGTYVVKAADWWRVGSTAIAAYDELDDFVFDRYVGLAEEKTSDAQRNAIVTILASAFGAVLAGVLAWLLGRNLSRRLQQVTDSAHTIAVDRLPEVLESLRNPTPEALAGAIPKVETTSTDEIGSLADSFNTVLRTAVETSIEHSTKRAETLTNLLINLGRRNQALLERQLKLIDTLEATEQDPAVLDGLFRLDHMVTRQRRNAESLLVLAGSRRSRAWSEPVPISDVIRGAISEVADMGRVDFEIPPGHDLLVTGAHAVDLSHLLAELIENATSYSSPSTTVQVRVQRNGLHVRVWVIDSGVGMSDDELAGANAKVADPPDIDELTTDRVGFQVVGRLARRLNAEVRLQINPVGGVAAGVDLAPATFEPLTGDLPIVAVAEAETRAAAPQTSAPELVADDGMLADLESESAVADDLPTRRAALPEVSAELPRRGAGGTTDDLPRRTPQSPAPTSTPLFGRSTPSSAPSEPVVAPVAAPPVTVVPVSEPVAEAPVLPRRAPAPVAAVEPDAPTSSGLARRTPGAALSGSGAAAEADGGLFRRLPAATEPAEPDPTDRLRTLRAFSRGVDEARRSESPS